MVLLNSQCIASAKVTINERNSTQNFDALKAEIEVINQKLVEQNVFVANQLSSYNNNNDYMNNNPNSYKKYNNNDRFRNYNVNEKRHLNDRNDFKNNKLNRNNYCQLNSNFNNGQNVNGKNFTGNQNRNISFRNNKFNQPHTNKYTSYLNGNKIHLIIHDINIMIIITLIIQVNICNQ